MTDDQGDRIGRFLAHLVIVDIGQIFIITEVGLIFSLHLSRGKKRFITFDQKLFGLYFGHFFTNSSGHPADTQIREIAGVTFLLSALPA
jgi:hypothetical protein